MNTELLPTSYTELRDSAALQKIRNMAPWELANLIDVPCHAEEGNLFLINVRDAWVEMVTDYGNGCPVSRDDNDEAWHQIADDAPSVYTTEKWRQFVDLRAWEQDISDYVSDETDMDKQASIALYVIADQLLEALHAELAEDEELQNRAEFFREIDSINANIRADKTLNLYHVVDRDGHTLTTFTASDWFETGPLEILEQINN